MYYLYQTGIRIYYFLIRIISPFSPRARAWREGRKNQHNAPDDGFDSGKKVIWFHASSLGEYEQGLPLMKKWREERPDWIILLTFFSPSGYRQQIGNKHADKVLYLPDDTRSKVRAFIDRYHPDCVVFIKYDIWPVLLKELQRRKIPVFLVSALFRKTQIFFKWYGPWYFSLLKIFTGIFVQNEQSKTLLVEKGLSSVWVCGDTRIDRVLEISSEKELIPGIDEFAGTSKIMIAGSSWPMEEKYLKQFLLEEKPSDYKVIIAPHDVSRGHLESIKEEFGSSLISYSRLLSHPEEATGKSVLLIDRIGLLSKLYRYGHIAIIGGAFGSGLHNVLEPAVFGLPVIFGPKYEKFVEAVELVNSGAGFSVKSYPQFRAILSDLMGDKNSLSNAGEGCRMYVNKSKGATGLIISHLLEKV